MSEQDDENGLGSKIIFSAIIILVVGVFALAAIPNFVRSGTSPANACINNLRQIDAAKQQWALEHNATSNEVVTINDIMPYIERERYNRKIKLDAKGNLPKCPSGGTYTIGKVEDSPTCSLGTNVTPDHVLR